MKDTLSKYQTHWHYDELDESLPETADSSYFFRVWDWRVQVSASAGTPGRVVDVACGNARDITWLSHEDWEAWGVDSSMQQLVDAREAAAKAGQRIHLVRAVAEFLPFKPGTFDSLICKSALDHFVDLDGAMKDFARVLQPNGRAVISANNYGGFTTRFSRFLYKIVRAVWPSARRKQFLWDSPVPYQHTFECTFDNIGAIGRPYFREIDRYGVSMLWGFPGWGRVISLVPGPARELLLRGLNKIAAMAPRWADVFVYVWQPKTVSS